MSSPPAEPRASRTAGVSSACAADEAADPIAEALVTAADRLAEDLTPVRPTAPVAFIYNPLEYAREAHRSYLKRFGRGTKKVVFLGMNPGPFGMGQTGVPFGEVAAVTGWLGIGSGVTAPSRQHPKRPIEGFACRRSEVSGRRLWGLFRDHEPDPVRFFRDHFVINYCPLLFLSDRGSNVTPDKLPAEARRLIESACDRHLVRLIEILRPEHLVGVGDFARKCAQRCVAALVKPPRIHSIIHPSPASPVANREWPERPRRQLQEAGIWT